MEEESNNLSNEELAKFVDEIENDDQDYDESVAESIRRIQYEEMLQNDLLPEEMMNDRAWGYTRRAQRDENNEIKRDESGKPLIEFKPVTYTEKRAEWDHTVSVWKKARENKRLEIKRRKLEIQKEALNSEFINIYSKLEVEHKKLLIKLLTDEYSKVMVRSEAFINRRVEALLKNYIPVSLRRCFAQYREAFIVNPGFLYIASKEYGEGKSIWVTPKLPYYFTQGTELGILKENEAFYLFKIDKAVVQFHTAKDMLSKRELQYAVKLRDIRAFYQLANKMPFWYDTLVQELKRQADEKQNGV